MRVPKAHKALYGLVLYLLLGASFDRLAHGVHPRAERVGAACPKAYLPSCLVPSSRAAGTNSLGYIGPELDRKEPGTVRIVCLGGSTSALPVGHSWPEALAERLAATHPERRFEVVNAALPGYGLSEVAVQLERELMSADVDVAIVSEPWNFLARRAARRRGVPEERPVWLQAIGRMPLAPLATRLAGTIRHGADLGSLRDLDRERSLEAYLGTLERIEVIADGGGMTLVLGLHPDGWPDDLSTVEELDAVDADLGSHAVRMLYPVERVRFKRRAIEATRAFAEREGLAVIDWDLAFRDRDAASGPELFAADDAHLSIDGADQMAILAMRRIEELLETGRVSVP